MSLSLVIVNYSIVRVLTDIYALYIYHLICVLLCFTYFVLGSPSFETKLETKLEINPTYSLHDV